MSDSVFNFQEFLKLVPGLVALPLTLFLGWKKIGTSVSFTYTWSYGRLGGRISSVTLINHKDKPVIINGLTAVYDGVRISLDEYTTPVILKAYESMAFNMPDYSYLSLYGKAWDIPYSINKELDIYIQLPDEFYKCKPIFKKSSLLRRGVWSKHTAHKSTHTHNKMVYNPETTLYVVDYVINGNQHTAFIHPRGFIEEAEGLFHNALNQQQLISPEVAAVAIQSANPHVTSIHAFRP